MTTTDFTLGEVLDLSEEIHGLQDQETGIKVTIGILDESISLVQKYWLMDLGKKARQIVEEIDPLRNELVKKYGESLPDGTIAMNAMLPVKNEEGEETGKVPNPKWPDFRKEYEELLAQVKKIEHHEFLLSDFSKIETKNRYSVFVSKVLRP